MLFDVLGKKLFKTRPCGSREARRGDVVAVERTGEALSVFGIYTGQDVITCGSLSRLARVHRESLADFSAGAPLMVYDFPDTYGAPLAMDARPSSVIAPLDKYLREQRERARKEREYHLYSAEDTVRRAELRLGSSDFTTSEHFALWCKTGISESHELARLKKYFNPICY